MLRINFVLNNFFIEIIYHKNSLMSSHLNSREACAYTQGKVGQYSSN
ncbi:hypothetical protein B6U46_08195 [Ligilactobacillus salivarius]|uniref:Uncharacterized protein n=2 Tax=Ligilactobacillus salivarius TaxID=1624 RepID=Q1WQZ3_LIGS1|nr:Hypothetical protein LSL_1899 [Ligilactobacillus salivarius UCC118]OQQ73208.1 hypothetical protein B6U64_09355 [Ligilactobacillus salivarius]OQQ82462.1 hypothetical protein B6U58_09155 [Ligilactobacillus salivarius]OQR05802.1 hypothetical protein B6U47_09455 [Ligilactobacillus salivarius]OQR06230.1 hypothetical protein B6U46_08195 [Ligilactobacillus salivarius]